VQCDHLHLYEITLEEKEDEEEEEEEEEEETNGKLRAPCTIVNRLNLAMAGSD